MWSDFRRPVCARGRCRAVAWRGPELEGERGSAAAGDSLISGGERQDPAPPHPDSEGEPVAYADPDLGGGAGGPTGRRGGRSRRWQRRQPTSRPRVGKSFSGTRSAEDGELRHHVHRRRRRPSASPIRCRKKARSIERDMDNHWELCAGLSQMSQDSNIPFSIMMTMPPPTTGEGGCTEAGQASQPEPSRGRAVNKSGTKTKQNNFSVDEDRLLVSCWLNASKDPVTATGQRKSSFWKTVFTNYNAQKSAHHPSRTLGSLEGRWADIKEQASKFESHYNSVLHEHRSGFTDSDKIAPAMTLHNSLERKPMSTIHCWEILRTEPKFLDLQDKPSNSKHVAGSGDPIDLTNSGLGDEEGRHSQTRPLKRPVGRDGSKAAKRASTSSGSESSTEYTSLMSSMHIQKLDLIKELDGAVATQMGVLIKGQEALIQIKQHKQEIEQLKEDERIMAIDLSKCNPGQRALYEALQKEILHRRTGH